MKTDRLYAVTLHLLNHGRTSAAELARVFDVSVRTIQRDIDSLCRAGIPVAAEVGASGGYYLPDSFRMDAQTATQEDYSHILTALKGYFTAVGDARVGATVEKISAMTGTRDSGVILDFSILREGDASIIQKLRTAIMGRKAVSFRYTNAENISRMHTVEPVAVIYRWYAWYLLAYSNEKDDYRTYKLVRMENLQITEAGFSREHASAETIMSRKEGDCAQRTTEIRARCRPEARAKAIEYLNGRITAEYEGGGCEMTLRVIETEHLWFGTLLSLGDGIEIIEPEHIRRRVIEAAEMIIKSYNAKEN